MKLLIVNDREVERLLPMRECIDVMAKALETLAREDALLPLRTIMWLPGKTGALGLMPAYLGDPKIMGVKVISVFPGNSETEFESHQGGVMLFEVENGRALALMDATAITGIRTAAVSGVATRALGNPDAGDLAILGTGSQAQTHLEAMRAVRSIRRVRVWGRNFGHAARFARRASERHGIVVEPIEGAADAVAGADIICTVTASETPVLLAEWLSPGAHINAVGACVPSWREVDSEAMARSRLFVDRREAVQKEAGDFILAREEGAVGDDHILGELGEVLLERIQGRGSAEQITLFESLGLAIEDLASAHHVYRRALEEGVGTAVEWGGERHGLD